MRKPVAIAFFLLGLATSGMGQSGYRGITVVNLSTHLSGDELLLDFDVRASGIAVDCDGQLIVEFALETSDRRLPLPVVIYSGATRSRFEARRRLLSDDYTVEPYHTYDRVKEEQAYKLDYRIAIPYQHWMAEAGLTCREYTNDCRGERVTSQGVLVDRFGGVPPSIYAASRRELQPSPSVVLIRPAEPPKINFVAITTRQAWRQKQQAVPPAERLAPESDRRRMKIDRIELRVHYTEKEE